MKGSFTLQQLSDPAFVASQLMQRRSVTPVNDGVIELLTEMFTLLEMKTELMPFGPKEEETLNIVAYSRSGLANSICFAGHSDVVPTGEGWSVDPFSGVQKDGYIYGRGAVDMKGALACMIASVARTKEEGLDLPVSFLITNDEEGPALFGTKPVVKRIEEEKRVPAFFLLGEPSSRDQIGDQIKLGRRGSISFLITAKGVQGHVAYPHKAKNPIHILNRFLHEITALELDKGNDYFESSSLQVVNLEVGNTADNIIPGKATAKINIRFNDIHTSKSLTEKLEALASKYDGISLEVLGASEAFRTNTSKLVECLKKCMEKRTGIVPKVDAGGGTSDARFLKDIGPVAELGLVNSTMHKVDECVSVKDLETLTTIYEDFLKGFKENMAPRWGHKRHCHNQYA